MQNSLLRVQTECKTIEVSWFSFDFTNAITSVQAPPQTSPSFFAWECGEMK